MEKQQINETKNEANFINPNELEGNFTQISNVVLTTYTQHPKFDANTFILYVTLSKYYNANYGYAFPKQSTLCEVTGISDRKTVRKHLRTLEQLDLIEIHERPTKGRRQNHVYLFKKPVQTIEEFFAKFPDIADDAKRRIEHIREEEVDGIERLSEYRQRKQAQAEEEQAAEQELQEAAEAGARRVAGGADDFDDFDENWI